MPKPSPSRFLRAAALTGVLGFTLLAGFLAWSDPYGIYRNMGLPHAGHPALTWSRIAAAERLAGKCDVALLGSSRVVFAFGTRLPRWGRLKVCNGALGGTSIQEQAEVIDFLVDETRVKAVLFFVDLHMFHDGRGNNHDFDQSRFADDRTGLTYYAWGLTSLDAIEYSTKLAGVYLPGFEAAKPLRSSSMETRGMIKTTLLKGNMYRRFDGPDESLATFERMLDKAQRHGIAVFVAIPAMHAMQLETLHTAGLWQTNKHWKRELVRITSERDIPLWDFGGYHSPATAPLPETSTEPPNPWWSDMSHPSQLLGKNLLARIRDAQMGRDGDWEPTFGVKLTPDNVEPHLAQMDTDRETWRTEHADQLAWFENVVQHATDLDPTIWDDFDRNRRRGAGEAVEDAPPLEELDLGEDEAEL